MAEWAGEQREAGKARGEARPTGSNGGTLRGASESGRRHRSPYGTAKSGWCHRSRRSGGVVLEGARDGRELGRGRPVHRGRFLRSRPI